MSLQTALQAHCQSAQPQAMAATNDGITSIGFTDLSEASLTGFVDVVIDWLKSSGVVPPKEDVITWVGEAFDQFIAPHMRPIVARYVRMGLLAAVSTAYDQLLK